MGWTRAQARARRWRCPPETVRPRSPSRVSRPSGSSSTTRSAPAARSAAQSTSRSCRSARRAAGSRARCVRTGTGPRSRTRTARRRAIGVEPPASSTPSSVTAPVGQRRRRRPRAGERGLARPGRTGDDDQLARGAVRRAWPGRIDRSPRIHDDPLERRAPRPAPAAASRSGVGRLGVGDQLEDAAGAGLGELPRATGSGAEVALAKLAKADARRRRTASRSPTVTFPATPSRAPSQTSSAMTIAGIAARRRS